MKKLKKAIKKIVAVRINEELETARQKNEDLEARLTKLESVPQYFAPRG